MITCCKLSTMNAGAIMDWATTTAKFTICCDQLQSKHVLAWTWVVSPAPDLMALVPESERRQLVCDLTEYIVEDYYLQRGFDIPEYSYVLHDRETDTEDFGEQVEGQNASEQSSAYIRM
jgi:hypothetical protein